MGECVRIGICAPVGSYPALAAVLHYMPEKTRHQHQGGRRYPRPDYRANTMLTKA